MFGYKGMEYQIDVRIDGQFYCRIYNQGLALPGPIFFTDNYPMEEEAIEAVKEIIQEYQAKADDK